MDTKTTEDLNQEEDIILNLISLHSPEIKLDKLEFLDLIKHSLSLDLYEKKRVIDAVPTLSQYQFDELSKVFIEERVKFKELAEEQPEDIQKLLKKQEEDWNSLKSLYLINVKKEENNLEKVEKEKLDEKKIEDIKSSLGL